MIVFVVVPEVCKGVCGFKGVLVNIRGFGRFQKASEEFQMTFKAFSGLQKILEG